MVPRRQARFPALVIASLLAGPVQASSDDLLRTGKEALKARRYDQAAALFAQGLQGSPDAPSRWQMLLGLALAHELSGDPVAAAIYYESFLAQSADHPEAATGRWAERRQSAAHDLAALESTLLETRAKLTFVSDPAGASVEVEGEATPPGATAVVRYLLPGQHTVEMSLARHLPLLVVVSVEAGQRVRLERRLQPNPDATTVEAGEPGEPPGAPLDAPSAVPSAAASAPSPAASVAPSTDASAGVRAPRAPVAQEEPRPWLAPVGWGMIGLGGSAIGIGIGLSAAAIGTGDELVELQQGPADDAALARDATLRERLATYQTGAAALYAGGGALAAGGLLVVILEAIDPSPMSSPSARPLVGPGFVGLRASF